MRQMKKICTVENGVEENRVNMKELEKRVESISEELKKGEDKVAKVMEDSERIIYEGQREREAIKLE